MLGWKAHVPGYRTKEDDMDLLMDKYNFPMNAVCLRLDSVTAGQFAARLRRAAEEADLFESHIIPLDMGKMILLNSQSTLELNTTPFPPPVNMFLKQKIKTIPGDTLDMLGARMCIPGEMSDIPVDCLTYRAMVCKTNAFITKIKPLSHKVFGLSDSRKPLWPNGLNYDYWKPT